MCLVLYSLTSKRIFVILAISIFNTNIVIGHVFVSNVKTFFRLWFALAVIQKDTKVDLEYVDKIKNIDLAAITKAEEIEASKRKVVENGSIVKFESSGSESSLSSDSVNTKESSNDQAKTPMVNFRISTKKAKSLRPSAVKRTSGNGITLYILGRKSLRIKRLKMKQPNLTKNHTEQTVSPFENNIMTKKTESTERGQKRRFEYEKTKFKHMFSEEDSTYNRKVGNSIYGHNGSPLI